MYGIFAHTYPPTFPEMGNMVGIDVHHMLRGDPTLKSHGGRQQASPAFPPPFANTFDHTSRDPNEPRDSTPLAIPQVSPNK